MGFFRNIFKQNEVIKAAISEAIEEYKQSEIDAEEENRLKQIEEEQTRLEEEKRRVQQAKAEATASGTPWVTIVNFDLDPNDVSMPQSVEFDWNEPFIEKLRSLGLVGTEIEIVDQWFQDICKVIAMETYDEDIFEQSETVEKISLPGGKAEYK